MSEIAEYLGTTEQIPVMLEGQAPQPKLGPLTSPSL